MQEAPPPARWSLKSSQFYNSRRFSFDEARKEQKPAFPSLWFLKHHNPEISSLDELIQPQASSQHSLNLVQPQHSNSFSLDVIIGKRDIASLLDLSQEELAQENGNINELIAVVNLAYYFLQGSEMRPKLKRAWCGRNDNSKSYQNKLTNFNESFPHITGSGITGIGLERDVSEAWPYRRPDLYILNNDSCAIIEIKTGDKKYLRQRAMLQLSAGKAYMEHYGLTTVSCMTAMYLPEKKKTQNFDT